MLKQETMQRNYPNFKTFLCKFKFSLYIGVVQYLHVLKSKEERKYWDLQAKRELIYKKRKKKQMIEGTKNPEDEDIVINSS